MGYEYMKKLIFSSIITLFSLSEAKMVGGIALVVEGEAITTTEIQALSKAKHISKKEAQERLILERLQKATLRDIYVSEEEVDTKIAKIAQQNHLLVPQMQQILKKRGTSWREYRKTIKEALKKEKLFQSKIAPTLKKPSQAELKKFYQKHRKSYVIPSRIRVVEYQTSDKEVLERFLRTHKTRGMKHRTLTKSTRKMNPALLETFLQTKVGNFTPPLNAGDRYILFKIKSKSGKRQLSFEEAQKALISQWQAKEQKEALKRYFQKVRKSASIETVR
jgi:parvulin-like peptidyl-prolyl isomerase